MGTDRITYYSYKGMKDKVHFHFARTLGKEKLICGDKIRKLL